MISCIAMRRDSGKFSETLLISIIFGNAIYTLLGNADQLADRSFVKE